MEVKMKKKMFLVAGMSYFILTLFLSADIMIYSQESDSTIKGIVTESDWDEDGNVTAVAIEVTIDTEEDEEGYSSEESDYYDVMMDNKGKELMDLLDKTIEATGTITVDEDGNKTIKVKKYKVIED
jgi:hypothetical protein